MRTIAVGPLGVLTLSDLTEGHLLAHAGCTSEARETLQRLLDRLRRGGASLPPKPVQVLAAEIENCTRLPRRTEVRSGNR